MRHLKLFEEFDGFVELTYIYQDHYVMVSISKNQVVDIYTDSNNDMFGEGWKVGSNKLFKHLDREHWVYMLDELVDSNFSYLIPVADDEGDDDKEYNKFQEEEVIRKQIPILDAETKYNL